MGRRLMWIGCGALALVSAASWAIYRAQVVSPEMAMKKQVVGYLVDPESARFRSIYLSPKDGVICGVVNAKNRMGGYTGDTRFMLFQDGDMRFEPDSRAEMRAVSEFDAMFSGFCGPQGQS